jgi:4-hydroxy-3-polyprenylbenzoate decarboxylase
VPDRRRIVVGITGASGAIYGVRLLQRLAELPDIETHLCVTAAAALTIGAETDHKPADVMALADYSYKPRDVGATIASGSFRTHGMVIAPCSIKTLSAIATSYGSDLLARAADVTLKEGRPLILAVRETPFHQGHLRLMQQAAEAGAVIAPPVPAFYHRPQTIEELVDHFINRLLDRLGIESGGREWEGMRGSSGAPPGV